MSNFRILTKNAIKFDLLWSKLVIYGDQIWLKLKVQPFLVRICMRGTLTLKISSFEILSAEDIKLAQKIRGAKISAF
jgi:hypothetical protein